MYNLINYGYVVRLFCNILNNFELKDHNHISDLSVIVPDSFKTKMRINLMKHFGDIF
jgi:hypothetical protein